MSFKITIVTVDDGKIEQILGGVNEALDYICDNVDPELTACMELITPEGDIVKGYYTIAEYLVKKSF